MALVGRGADGERVELLPSHDPDDLEAMVARELAVERAIDAVIAAARAVAEDAGWRERYWCAAYGDLDRALAAYDAALRPAAPGEGA